MKKKLAAAAAVMTALFSMTGCATTADGAATGANGATSLIMIVGYMVIIIGVMYFVAIRPQKKEQKKQSQMLSALEVGDIVLTTSGFYGTVIDITDDTVIVEFGNNKNCRIPMQKSAIVEAEKPDAEYSRYNTRATDILECMPVALFYLRFRSSRFSFSAAFARSSEAS